MKYKNWNEVPLKGVYLLWRDNKVIYVGQSNYLIRRIKSHSYDFFSYELIDSDEIRAKREAELIKKYAPILNLIKSQQTRTVIGTYKKREYRRECLIALIRKHGWLSCRVAQKLLAVEYGINVNHNTINSDLRKIRQV